MYDFYRKMETRYKKSKGTLRMGNDVNFHNLKVSETKISVNLLKCLQIVASEGYFHKSLDQGGVEKGPTGRHHINARNLSKIS